MRLPFKYNLRLKPSILTAFLLLTVPVLSVIIAVTYFSNDRIAHANARELVARFRVDGIENIQSVFDPLKSLVRAAATLGDEQPQFYLDNRSIKYFFSILQHSERMVSVYAGLADGSFRQARRIDPVTRVQQQPPPAEAAFAFRWIEADSNVDRYVFLDKSGRGVGAADEPTRYDPRARGWYRNTASAGTLYITDPDVFAAFGLIGFTVAAPFMADGQLAGIVAADITLDGLSSYLADRKISAHTLSFILDEQGRVLAASDLSKTYRSVKGRVELSHISDLENELPAMAYGARPRKASGDSLYSFVNGGKEYIGSVSALPNDFGKQWQLFVITPVADFAGPFESNNNFLLALGLGATLVEVLIIYLLSGIISAPLERLALNVGKIRDLSGESAPGVTSQIREIAVLSRAIETLDNTLRSFASFVPVGLVRQLLESEQKLELGGHSRFLTVFFSDLEAFSSLSEELPSQELLLRVSSYLGIVTQAVNEELGTIDKFLGDGVMAFWGAPVLIEDHAWRACVAALRIQRAMEPLNAQWRAEGLRPLRVRIGIHSDAVVVGNIGSKERMSYTVIGDGVNVASRLESMTKDLKIGVCISQSVFKEAGERLCVRPIDEIPIRGRRGKITAYELLGVYGADPALEPTPERVRLSELSRVAYEAVATGNTGLAIERYTTVLAEFPDDPLAQSQIAKLRCA